MSTAVGNVSSIKGTYVVKSGDGTIKILAVGSIIYEDDIILGRGGQELEIVLSNGDSLLLHGDVIASLDKSVVSSEEILVSDASFNTNDFFDGVDKNQFTLDDTESHETASINLEKFVAGSYLDRLGLETEVWAKILPHNSVISPERLPGEGVVITQTSSITVNAVNDAPTLIVESTKTVAEDGTTSITFSAGDTEGAVTVIASADHGSVTVNADNTITYVPAGNYNGSDTITVSATDSEGVVITQTSSITVNAVNDAITQVVDIDSSSNQISENLPTGSYTGVTLLATDSDGDAITYSLPSNVPFTVGLDGKVYTSSPLDYESQSSYTFSAIATSVDGTSSVVPVTINITDIDDTSPTATISMSDTALKIGDTSTVTITFSEPVSNFDNSDVTVENGTLGTLSSSDGKIWTGTFTPSSSIEDTSNVITLSPTYTDVIGNAGSSAVSATYAIDTLAPIPTITINSITADNAISSVEASGNITITGSVTNANNGDSVVLNVAGINYSTTVLNGGFSVPVPGSQIIKTSSVTASISTVDIAGNVGTISDAQSYTINLNVAPIITSGSNTSIAENSATATVVYKATATDANNDTITYSLSGTDAAKFNINSSTGDVTLKAVPNYELQSTYNITVKATDNGVGILSSSQALTITVVNINESPTAVTFVNVGSNVSNVASVFTVQEDFDAGSVISGTPNSGFLAGNSNSSKVLMTLGTTDQDAGETFVYTLTDPSGKFELVNGNQIAIKSGVVLDAEVDTSSYFLDVESKDSNNNSITKTFEIKIEDFEGVFVDVSTAANTVIGTSEEDTITMHAGAYNDTYNGGLGIDTIVASATATTIDLSKTTAYATGTGTDTILGFENITGGAKNDNLIGSDGVNTIFGGAGDDIIEGGAGADFLYGGATTSVVSGTDTLSYSKDTTGVMINLVTNTVSGGDAEGDTIFGFTNVYGGSGDDTLIGTIGNNLIRGGSGADSIDGGAGIDTLDYMNDTIGVNVNLTTNETSGGEAEGDTIQNFERVYSGSGNDTLIGTSGDNLLYAYAGNDRVDAGSGNDTVQDSAGSDVLSGGAGIDTIYYSAPVATTVDLMSGIASDSTGSDVIDGFENVSTGNGNDTIIGDSQNNTINTAGGIDTVVFSGNRADYTVFSGYNGTTQTIVVRDNRSDGDGIDTLIAVEKLQFADGIVPTVNAALKTAGTEANGTALFTITLSSTPLSDVTVYYTTVNGTATAGQDYTTVTGSVTFTANTSVLTQNVSVPVTNDTIYENSESFSLMLTSATNAILAGNNIANTIADNESAPTNSYVSAVSAATAVNEGSYSTFNVTVKNPDTVSDMVVNLKLTSNTATVGSDTSTVQVDVGSGLQTVSVDANGMFTVTIPAQLTTADKTFSVKVLATDDVSGESSETYLLGAGIGGSNWVNNIGTINTSDVTFSVSDVTALEGNMAVVSVTLSAPLSNTVQVNYATGNLTSAIAGDDYNTISGTLVFVPGQTVHTFMVPILADSISDDGETFKVTLSGNTTGTSLVNASGHGNGIAWVNITDTVAVVLDITPPSVSMALATDTLQYVTSTQTNTSTTYSATIGITNIDATIAGTTTTFTSGNDTYSASNNVGAITLLDGNDAVKGKYAGSTIYLDNADGSGTGNDYLHLTNSGTGNSSTGSIYAGGGNDSVLIDHNYKTGIIDMGAGDDKLNIAMNLQNATNSTGGTVNLGDGNDNMYVGGQIGIAGSTYIIDAGAGDDVVFLGNSSLAIDYQGTTTLNMGDGNDFVRVDGLIGTNINTIIDGGAGTNDSIYLSQYTSNSYMASIGDGTSGISGQIKNFENIMLGDGTLIAGNVSAFTNKDTPYTTTTSSGTTTTTTYSGTAIDGITSDGMINLTLSSDTANWQYSVDNGVTWTAGVGTSFTLGVGNYAVDAVQVKAFDAAGNAAVTKNAASISILSTDLMSTPIMLDLNGDGIHTSSITNGTQFDLDADGNLDQVGWSDGKDAFLVHDINKDGQVNDGSELFGSSTILKDGSKATDGYEALGALDVNKDNVINSQDTAYNELKLWIDANQDGKVDDGEMMSLKDAGVESMNLTAKNDVSVDNGNIIGLESSFTTTSGETHDMADVWFAEQSNIPSTMMQNTEAIQFTGINATIQESSLSDQSNPTDLVGDINLAEILSVDTSSESDIFQNNLVEDFYTNSINTDVTDTPENESKTSDTMYIDHTQMADLTLEAPIEIAIT